LNLNDFAAVKRHQNAFNALYSQLSKSLNPNQQAISREMKNMTEAHYGYILSKLPSTTTGEHIQKQDTNIEMGQSAAWSVHDPDWGKI
jgi:hypothetical protein